MSLADISGPLYRMPYGTTLSAQGVTNGRIRTAKQEPCLRLRGHGHARLLIDSGQSGLSAEIKEKKPMLVPRTAEDFSATVSAMRSLDESKGVNFHTSFRENGRVRLLVKNLGRHAWGRHPGEVGERLHLCPGNLVAPLKTIRLGSLQACPFTPAIYCVCSAGTGSDEITFLDRTMRFASLGGDIASNWPAVPKLSTLRSYASVLWLPNPVWCFWWGSLLGGVLHLTAAS
jgi:hypothetical protein